MSRAVVAVLLALVLTACSTGDASEQPVPSAAPTASAQLPTPTPTVSPDPTPQEEFAAEVEELYGLVQEARSRGPATTRRPPRCSSAFATTVALIRVEPDQTDDRQRVVDAAEATAEAYRTTAGITGAVERAAAARHAVVLLREL